MQALLSTGRIGAYEKEYFRKDGSRLWMVFASASLGDGTVIEYCMDVSDRKRAEEQVRQGEQDLLVVNAALTRANSDLNISPTPSRTTCKSRCAWSPVTPNCWNATTATSWILKRSSTCPTPSKARGEWKPC